MEQSLDKKMLCKCVIGLNLKCSKSGIFWIDHSIYNGTSNEFHGTRNSRQFYPMRKS